MDQQTNVILITGFLGSGKTTFLNKLIAFLPRTSRPVILMNEFGETGIDGVLIEDEDLDIIEINKGSIFCVCVKTDFIKGLLRIKQELKPHLLIIEATGTANPKDLKRDLQLPLFNDCFRFDEQFCVIDALNFNDTYSAFNSVDHQIQSSSVFIINKTDTVPRSEVDSIRQIILDLQPEGEIFETTYCDIPFERFVKISEAPDEGRRIGSESKMVTPRDDELEKIVLDNSANISPPDLLQSAVYNWRGQNIDDFMELVTKLPKGIVRAKALIQSGDNVYLFNWVMGTHETKQFSKSEAQTDTLNRLVCIGSPEDIEQLNQLIHNDIGVAEILSVA